MLSNLEISSFINPLSYEAGFENLIRKEIKENETIIIDELEIEKSISLDDTPNENEAPSISWQVPTNHLLFGLLQKPTIDNPIVRSNWYDRLHVTLSESLKAYDSLNENNSSTSTFSFVTNDLAYHSEYGQFITASRLASAGLIHSLPILSNIKSYTEWNALDISSRAFFPIHILKHEEKIIILRNLLEDRVVVTNQGGFGLLLGSKGFLIAEVKYGSL